MGRGTVAGRARDYSLEVYQIMEAEGSVRVRLSCDSVTSKSGVEKSRHLPCASFSHVDHFHKKAAAQVVVLSIIALSTTLRACLWARVA